MRNIIKISLNETLYLMPSYVLQMTIQYNSCLTFRYISNICESDNLLTMSYKKEINQIQTFLLPVSHHKIREKQ